MLNENLQAHSKTSDMNPFSMDGIASPALLPIGNEANPALSLLSPLPAPTEAEALPEALPEALQISSPVPVPVEKPLSGEVEPPDLKSDPMLESVMQQAQQGLFVLPNREKSAPYANSPVPVAQPEEG